jgi:ATP-dependent helicase/nuclease subunit B
MAADSPRVFTIPASAPFLPTLIRALVEGRLVEGFPTAGDPLALAQATLYLPTRRACRLAREEFLDVIKGDAAILPRILAIGDIDEDEIAFAEYAAGALAADALDLPDTLKPLDRRLLLAELVVKWAERLEPPRGEAPLIAGTPAAALALADDLARLIDDMTTRRVPWQKLDGLVPDNLDKYWQLTLGFLKIARERWPEILAERGVIEPAERRDRLIAAEAARLAKNHGPVIAAGSTGSIPATAELIAAVARAPQGAVVLPGLDTDLDEDAWRSIAGARDGDGRMQEAPAAGHPQFAMQALLARIGIAREAVTTLGEPAVHGREVLISEALRPAAATDAWSARLARSEFAALADAALAEVTLIEAANAEEEALAIAIALREAVEDKDKTAALITPDRALARRVLAALSRWQVAADDSGGDALPDTAPGIFARLAAEATLGGLEPVTLLALIKHPLLRLGAEACAIAVLERAILRGPRPRAGSEGLRHALHSFRSDRDDLHRSDPRANISDAEIDLAAVFVERLAAALAPLETLRSAAQVFAVIAAAHREVIANLARDQAGEIAAFAGAEGTALATVFDDIAASAPAIALAVARSDYAELFHSIIAGRVVRRPGTPGVRVRIFGPLEARLTHYDRVVLGGLNEGTWPPEAASDAWLSRPMRHDLGLDLPERRIGLSAHDFAQGFGAHEVILSRAAKVAGAPTTPARFVQRLAAVAGEKRWKEVVGRGARYLAYARLLDEAAEVKRIERPAPRPPRAARPQRLSVTEIEHWLRDPYSIYAKHILRLAPLDPVDLPPGGRDRGIVIHDAIGEFAKAFAQELPQDCEVELVRIGARHFEKLADYPEANAFWWPRFQRIAHWLARFEAERRARIDAISAEIDGKIAVGNSGFVLSARADRIERRSDGRYAILDYKTGLVPSEKQVRLGLAPQLTLEAAILRQGGFQDIPAGASVAELVYVALKGGEPAGQDKVINFKEGTPDAQADRALSKLKTLVARFEDESQPYRALVLSMWKSRYGSYDHLARIKEWSLGEDDGGSE